jgi:hypothetical protein
MFQILINGIAINLLQPVVGDVKSIIVNKHPLLPIQLDERTHKAVKEWLVDLVKRCDGLISYNGVFMFREDCNV